ncbi:MAG: ATP-binding cassette domain-containing protein [Bdellovibrionota bacterium]
MSLIFDDRSHLSLPNGTRLRLEGTIASGEIVGLQGPSGCGKSTLLKHLAQVGEAPFLFQLNGRSVDTLSSHERKISLVFQRALLFPHLNVKENVLFPLRFQDPYRSWSRDLQEKRVAEFLSSLSLAHLSERSVSALSGGEAMRVALLRALVSGPQCLLLDEAFAALDKETKGRVKEWLRPIIKKNGIPTILVAHVAEDLAEFAERSVSWPADSALLHF